MNDIVLRQLSSRRVLVTGGAGFIGSHLVEKLLDFGADVVVVDNFTHGNKIEHLGTHPNLTVYNADVVDTGAISPAFKDRDIVIHLAALVGVEETQLSPLDVLDVDINGIVNVLNLCVSNNVKRIVFASSSEVYGDMDGLMKEDAHLSPISTYAVTKLVGEEYCKAFYRKYGLEYTILRYFNVYGPRQDERFVVSRFFDRALTDQSIVIYGDGNQTRDFTYVEDVAYMTLAAALKDEARCQVINIGTGVTTTINKLASLIPGVFNRKNRVQPVHVDYDATRPVEIEVFNRAASIVKARHLLDCRAEVSLESGLKIYKDWYLKRNRLLERVGIQV
jgi:nucleoside-diphosphate-sugar epimerase